MLSPASTDRFRHSISLSCTGSTAPNSQEQDLMQLDSDTSSSDASSPRLHIDEAQQQGQNGSPELTYARSETFLHWAVGQPNSPPWTKLGSIRHVDVTEFGSSLYLSDIPEIRHVPHYEICSSLPGGPVQLLTFPMTISEVKQITSCWSDHCVHSLELDDEDFVSVGFTIHNFCDEYTWQTKRVLACLLWNASPVSPGTSSELEVMAATRKPSHERALRNLGEVLLEARQLCGPDSLQYALDETILTLEQNADNDGLLWKPYGIGQSNGPHDLVSDGPLLRMRAIMPPDASGVWIHGSTHIVRYCNEKLSPQLSSSVTISHTTSHTTPILAIRSPSWPASCPQFCLFVFDDIKDDSERALYRLLEEAIREKNFLGHPDFKWDRDASRTLGRWRKALEDAARRTD